MSEEYDKGVPMVLAPQMGAIDATVMSTGIIGFAAGFLFSLLMVVVLPILVW